MEGRSPAQLYVLVFGVVLVVEGIVGFFYEPEFTNDESVRDAVFGILDVNGWHNVVHILSGVAGLALMGTAARARAYAIGLAAVYTIVAIWGFAIGNGESILGFLPVNTEDNVLHALIAVAGYAAFAASVPRPARTVIAS